jgi:hypothetical protein
MQQPDLLAGMVVVVVVFRSGQIAFDLAQLDVAVEHEFERGIGQGRRVLGDVGHDPARRALKVAAVGMQLATQQRRKEDLPQPLAPVRPTFQPGCSCSEAPVTRGSPLREKPRSRSRIIGA